MAGQRIQKKADEKTSVVESLFGTRRPKEDTEPVKTMTVRQETKKLRRVMKTGKMARKHGSEAFQATAMTQKDVQITEQVMESVAPSMPTPPQKTHETFICIQCGAEVPLDAERCPICQTLYIKDASDEALDEVDVAETALDEDADAFMATEATPCIHFDAETGTISYLENDNSDPDFMLECSHCGTAVQFTIDRCPICGTKLDVTDTGIVSLFANMEFGENDLEEELDCPFCGEHVSLVEGTCPACHGKVEGADTAGKIEPVVHGENVVFLHLDVETGELNYLQRLAKRLGFEQMTVHLDGIGSASGFEKDWKSLSRI
jgi:rubrerythrin